MALAVCVLSYHVDGSTSRRRRLVTTMANCRQAIEFHQGRSLDCGVELSFVAVRSQADGLPAGLDVA